MLLFAHGALGHVAVMALDAVYLQPFTNSIGRLAVSMGTLMSAHRGQRDLTSAYETTGIARSEIGG